MLETDRLFFRPYCPDDLPFLARLLKDPDVVRSGKRLRFRSGESVSRVRGSGERAEEIDLPDSTGKRRIRTSCPKDRNDPGKRDCLQGETGARLRVGTVLTTPGARHIPGCAASSSSRFRYKASRFSSRLAFRHLLPVFGYIRLVGFRLHAARRFRADAGAVGEGLGGRGFLFLLRRPFFCHGVRLLFRIVCRPEHKKIPHRHWR